MVGYKVLGLLFLLIGVCFHVWYIYLHEWVIVMVM